MEVFFFLQLLTLICAGVFWFWIAHRKVLVRIFPGADTLTPPLVGTTAIILGFFIGFGGADMRDQSRALRLAAQQEANDARSILKFAEGVGATAEPLRDALVEYLEAATTVEKDWLTTSTAVAPPAQPMADSLVLSTTSFVLQAKSPDPLKNLLVNSVDRMRQARVARLALSRQTNSRPEWLAITLLGLITQAMLAFAMVGKPRGTLACIGGFSLALVAVYFYLASIDAILGTSKVELSIGPLKDVVASIN